MNTGYKVVAKKVIQFIVNAPRGVRLAALKSIVTYIIGNGQHGLKHYPAYKYVMRKRAYGKSFKSNAQQGFVMASLRAGYNLKTGSPMDPGYPHRTGNYQRSIRMKDSNDWKMVTIAGELPHAGWPNRQARLVGWRDWPAIVQSNLAGALRAGMAEVNRWLKSQKGK